MKSDRIIKAISRVWRAKKAWLRPKKAKVLLVYRDGADLLREYLDFKCVEILDLEDDSFNVYVLMRTLMKHGLRSDLTSYAQSYVALVAPDFLITFIDNSPLFYRLKPSGSSMVSVAIQNGLRDDELFRHCDSTRTPQVSYTADYVLCFGGAISEKYKNCFNTQTLAIGSIKNNKF